MQKIDLTNADQGLSMLDDFSGSPDQDGVLAERRLKLPEIAHICHYAADQRREPGEETPPDEVIGGRANRAHCLHIDGWDETIEGGLFAVLELVNGDWMVVLPVAGTHSLA